ncbi:MAG: fibronectin type III-like domain-contianing protein, partial [Bacteroidales bacterium]|nr:fibronectin type III-like domain-contianing protein [Bacteroidales bacterium]
ESIEVSVELKNTGSRDADEEVQLYVHRLEGTGEWPAKELKAFQRVSMKAGESKTITLSIPVEQLKYWNEEEYGWKLEHGEIELMLGASSADIRTNLKVKI